MDLVVSKALVVQQLKDALSQEGEGPILLHSDILRIGMLDELSDRDTMCSRYEEVLEEIFADRTYLLPTFNYDFCRDGIYDVQNSPSQVGALTDYYRTRYWAERTHTPVFHFCIRHNKEFSLAPAKNCFGVTSTFAELVAHDGLVAILGPDLSCATFIHHVEEICNIQYRFLKTFDGAIIDGQERLPFKLVYRVRPLEPPNAVVYDWKKIESDLVAHNLLRSFPVGRGELRIFRAAAVASYWYSAIANDPHYLLM